MRELVGIGAGNLHCDRLCVKIQVEMAEHLVVCHR
jgi:hypothetical protein